MIHSDIAELLIAPEGKTLEFKRDLSSLKQIVKTVVAFANTDGGTLIIGREDDGKMVGVEDPLLAEEKLFNAIADSIMPCGWCLHTTGINKSQSWSGIYQGRSQQDLEPCDCPSIQRDWIDVPVNERQAWFMEQLQNGHNCKASDLAAQWQVTEKTAKRDIADLKNKGLVEFVGATKTGGYVLAR